MPRNVSENTLVRSAVLFPFPMTLLSLVAGW